MDKTKSKCEIKYPGKIIYIPLGSSKKIYCGKSKIVPKKYKSQGTRWECLKKGWGAGSLSSCNVKVLRQSDLPTATIKELKLVARKKK